jgi:hypothetical protein
MDERYLWSYLGRPGLQDNHIRSLQNFLDWTFDRVLTLSFLKPSPPVSYQRPFDKVYGTLNAMECRFAKSLLRDDYDVVVIERSFLEAAVQIGYRQGEPIRLGDGIAIPDFILDEGLRLYKDRFFDAGVVPHFFGVMESRADSDPESNTVYQDVYDRLGDAMDPRTKTLIWPSQYGDNPLHCMLEPLIRSISLAATGQ